VCAYTINLLFEGVDYVVRFSIPYCPVSQSVDVVASGLELAPMCCPKILAAEDQ